jgi:hypothetical protein
VSWGVKKVPKETREIETEKRKIVGKNVQKQYQRIVHLLPIRRFRGKEIQE